MKLICSKIILAAAVVIFSQSIFAQPRIGEKLSYQISLDRFSDAGYAELQVVSTGKLGGRDVIEFRSRIKTLDLVSAAFFLVDQTRTVYIAPDTGLPVFIRNIDSGGPLAKETVQNYLNVATANYDIVSLIYKARSSGGSGSFPVFEDAQQYVFNFQPGKPERIKTDAGEFETTISTVTSEYLTARGLRDVRINFSTDEERIPILFRFKIGKSELRFLLVGISKSEPTASPTPTPDVVKTPLPQITPRPTPSPTPYIDDRPLASELGFKLGESFDYRVTSAGQSAGTITLSAKERRLINSEDSLVLSAEVTTVEPNGELFFQGDHIRTLVDPETLAPRSDEIIFRNAISGLNGTATFDKRTGQIKPGASPPFDAPVGTHSLLSLIYAMRSFNLTPSRDPSASVNDTRVAVFWNSDKHVFTLRPSGSEEITINGLKFQAQMISITTGVAQIDALAPKVWLSTADSRVPLRFSIGTLQAEIVQK